MNLHILDTSNYIYAGSFHNQKIVRGVREYDGEYSENSAPIGGVSHLLNGIKNIIYKHPDDLIVPVFDSTPNLKRALFSEVYGQNCLYKGNRKKADRSIGMQKELAYKLLTMAGFNTQLITDYESDDIIYTYIKEYKDMFDHVYIYTLDSDLYFMIDSKVTIEPVGAKGKQIDVDSYPYAAKTNEYTPYNVLHLRKLCAGDHSDNIEGISKAWEKPIDDSVVDLGIRYEDLGNIDLCNRVLMNAVENNPNLPYANRVMQTFKILMPFTAPLDSISNDITVVDKVSLRYLFNNFDSSYDRVGFEDVIKEYIDEYYK